MIRLVKWIMLGFKFLMESHESCSRAVFLLHSVVCSLGILFLSVAFAFVRDKTDFVLMVATLSGGGLAAAAGRYATKVGDGHQGPPVPNGELREEVHRLEEDQR